MLIYSMSVSVDGFITDREGEFGWTAPGRGAVSFPHRADPRTRRLFVRANALPDHAAEGDGSVDARDRVRAAFADIWRALPKIVFSRTLDSVQGNARLAGASVALEVAAALDATDKDVSIGGAGLGAAAIELGLVDELRMFRDPIIVGGGTPF